MEGVGARPSSPHYAGGSWLINDVASPGMGNGRLARPLVASSGSWRARHGTPT